MSERSEFSIFRALMIRMIVRIYVITYEAITSIQKSLRKASFPTRTPHKEPLGGVRKGRAWEGSVEGPCGRSLSVPPDYGVVMSMTKIL